MHASSSTGQGWKDECSFCETEAWHCRRHSMSMRGSASLRRCTRLCALLKRTPLQCLHAKPDHVHGAGLKITLQGPRARHTWRLFESFPRHRQRRPPPPPRFVAAP